MNIEVIKMDPVGKILGEKKHTDSTGYYTGYCQCPCEDCREGKKHCQGLICRGD